MNEIIRSTDATSCPPSNTSLNLLDLCKDIPREIFKTLGAVRGSVDKSQLKELEVHPIIGFLKLEQDGFKEMKESADIAINSTIEIGKLLDKQGTRIIEQKCGRNLFTESLDKTRDFRYGLVGDLAQVTVDIGIDTVKGSALKHITRIVNDVNVTRKVD